MSDPSIAALINAGEIIGIEKDLNFALNSRPNDPEFDKQWGLFNRGEEGGISDADIQALNAWKRQSKGKGIVGIIDTGIDFTHPDLIHNIWQNLAEDADRDGRVIEYIDGRWQLDPGDLDNIDADNNGYIDDLIGWDFVNDDNNPWDDNGHGTHIAGIIGASGNNQLGITGVAWNTQMMALKSFNEYGFGSLSDILPALEYARKMGVLLTNNSWGSTQRSDFLFEEIAAAADEGQIFVAAAGNGGYSNPRQAFYPAAYELENILAVTSSNHRDQLSAFSSIGRLHVDLAAPGENIYSTLPGNTYGFKSGSSMAAGFASGSILLIKALQPELEVSDIISRILLNVDVKSSLFGACRSRGRLNINKALRNRRSALDPNVLLSSIDGPLIACTGSLVQFTNTSIIPRPQLTESNWYVNGVLMSSEADFEYEFSEKGWYEIELEIKEGRKKSSSIFAIEIQDPASADLGPDRTLCASAFLLEAANDEHQISWSRIFCPNDRSCLQKGDFTTLDPLVFDLSQALDPAIFYKYLILDAQGKIIRIAEEPSFDPIQLAARYKLVSIHYCKEEEVSGLELGNKLNDIKFGSGNCGGIDRPYHNFRIWEAQELGSDTYLSVQETGLYVLKVRDACGNIATDTLALKLTKECVWPGDVNIDGSVNMLDFLCLALANGQEGKARDRIDSRWEAHRSRPWNTKFHLENDLAPGVNHRHADINGDGKVDMDADLLGLYENLSLSQDWEVPFVQERTSFYIEHHDTHFSLNGDTAFVQFGLYMRGERNTALEEIHGIALNLNFSDPVFSNPEFIASNQWPQQNKVLGFYSNSNSAGIGAQNLPWNSYKFSLGITSTNPQNFSGSGMLASGNIIVIVDDIVDEELNTGYSSFGISAENILLIDKEGRIKAALPSQSLKTYQIDINWPSPPLGWVDLSAWKEGRDVVIEWQTEGERFSDLFQLERSVDNRLFERIAEIPATGLANGRYFFRDLGASGMEGESITYRVRRLDVADRVEFSPSYVLNLDAPDQEKLRVYPNPLKEELHISYALLSSQGASIELLNALGQRLYVQANLEDFGEIEIDSSNWPPGIYYVRLSSDFGNQVFKLVKVKE